MRYSETDRAGYRYGRGFFADSAVRRCIASLLLPVLFLTVCPNNIPVIADEASGALKPSQGQMAISRIKAAHGAPPVSTAIKFTLSPNPSTQELRQARIFTEPLFPVGGKASGGDNAALAAALIQFAPTRDRSVMEDYIAANPQSPWLPSVLTNVGLIEFQDGYFSTALSDFNQAWTLGKNDKDPVGRLVIDRAAAELMKMYCRIGRTQQAEDLLTQLKKRPFQGMAANMMHDSIQGTRLMDHQPKDCFKCGPYAVWNIASYLHLGTAQNAKLLEDYATTKQGVALTSVLNIAAKMGLKMQMAKRLNGTDIPLPSVIHWKLNHYGALLAKSGDRYLLADPTFGRRSYVLADAVNKESDGYFLVPNGNLPSGWAAVGQNEGNGVFGRGDTGGQKAGACTTSDGKTCSSPGGHGLSAWSFHLMLTSLHIEDTPVGYTPQLGPDMHLTVTYDHRESNQPSVINYSNFGPLWNFNWVSTLTFDSGGATVNNGTGGTSSYDLATGTSGASGATYSPNRDTEAVLVEDSASQYEVDAKDGSRMIFGLEDSAGTFYLTQICDTKGNCVTMTYYAGTTRLDYVTDALGQQSYFHYVSDTVGDSGYYLVSSVVDAFGRTAHFTYSSGELQSVTDPVGNESQYTYGSNAANSVYPNSFISALTTPYGTTNFSYTLSTDGNTRTLLAQEPNGAKQMVEGINDDTINWPPTGSNPAPTAAPPNQFPSTGNFDNEFLNYRNSLYWDRKAMSLAPGDWRSAHIYHYFHDGNLVSEVLEAEKPSLENWIWYAYQGEASQTIYLQAGEYENPTQIARVLDNGSTQMTQMAYNSLGNITQYIDPLGRTTNLNYYSNGIDLQTVTQVNGASSDTLATYTWNGAHEPLTYTDRAGEETHYSYYSNSQLESITDPKSETTTLNYTSGYLTSIQGPDSSSLDLTTLGYDSAGHISSVTNGESYELQYTWDSLDRLTKITYPDGTYEQNTYTTLDITQKRDRQARLTNYTFNGLDQMTSVTDANGHTTSYGWCSCGSLKSITDGNGHVTRWNQDVEGRPISKTYADGTQELTTYENSTSRVHSVTDAKGQAKVYAYNNDDALASITYANPQNPTAPVKLTYDPYYKRITNMQDGVGITNYSYVSAGSPGAGKVSQVTGPWSNSTVAYTYDQLGRVLSRSINGTAQNFQYDVLGRVNQVVNALGTFNYTFQDDSNRVTNMTVPNGEQVNYTYLGNTGDRRLSQIQNLQSSSSNISTFGYPSYNEEGSIATWNQTIGSSAEVSYSLGYDDTDELTSGSATGSSYGYTYDSGGNRLTETINGSTTTAKCNAVNELQQLSPAKPGDKTYQWDAENRLVSISYTGTAQQTHLSYDGMSRCVQIQELNNGAVTATRRFLWCGAERCEERDAYDNLTKRFFNQGEQIWGQSYYFMKDHLGSVREMTDSTGTVRASYSYDFWGRRTKLSGNLDSDFGFTGLFYHQTSQLCLAVFRSYDPNSARWLSRDPFEDQYGNDAELALGPNLYGYLNNDPLEFSDPLGLCGPGRRFSGVGDGGRAARIADAKYLANLFSQMAAADNTDAWIAFIAANESAYLGATDPSVSGPAGILSAAAGLADSAYDTEGGIYSSASSYYSQFTK